MNSKKSIYSILGIIFVVFSIVSFLLLEKKEMFYIGYIFCIIAFIVWLFVFYKNYNNNNSSLNSKFLKLPIIYLATFYVLIQIVLFYILMYIDVSLVISIVVYIILLGINLLLLISVSSAVNKNELQEKDIKEKKNYLKEIEIDLEILAKKEENDEQLNKLIEKVKFSDPMSSIEVKDIEIKIDNLVKELDGLENNTEKIKEIELLLDKRNKKVKMLKK